MARADLLIELVRAARQGEQDALRGLVEAIIAEEDAKQHHVLADRLRQALRDDGRLPRPAEDARGTPRGLWVGRPERRFDDLVLPHDVIETCWEIVDEQRRLELLRAHGLEPRHRVLLIGPPGTGKTSVAEALADALMLPLAILRYEAVIGSFLGETGSRLSDVFAWARSRRCVLFLDEFDAIAKERGDEHETGEVKRVVSSLLMLIDDLPAHVVVIAASNHPELLDRGAARRFELVFRLPRPSVAARTRWWENFLTRHDLRVGASPKTLAARVPASNFSELENLGQDILRQTVLQAPADPVRVASARIARWRERQAKRRA